MVLAQVVIDGAFPEFETEIRELVRTIEAHRVTVAQIYEFANALEQLHARAGYVLVRVTVPPQELKDNGSLRVVVVDGFVERIEADAAPERLRALVAKRIASLVGRRHIRLDEIERRLLTAGDVPGLRLRSTLARGATPGGALLVLEGTHRPVSATLTVDNRLPSSLGTWSYGAVVELNSPFGFGELLYGSAEFADDPRRIIDLGSPLTVLGAGAVVPIGIDGWMVNPEYTFSRSDPEPEDGGLDNIGRFERFSLRSWYPLIRTRSETLTLSGELEQIHQSIALPLFDTDLNEDRYAVLRIGAAFAAGLPCPTR